MLHVESVVLGRFLVLKNNKNFFRFKTKTMSFGGDFGVICFNHEKVVFGSSKSKNLPKMTHFDTFLYGNHHELYDE